MIEIFKTFLANKINSLLFTTCKFSSIMVGYCYIYIKKPNFIVCDRCEHQKIIYFFMQQSIPPRFIKVFRSNR